MGLPIDAPLDLLADFCRRWKISEVALFGSVLRSDFRGDSDVDVLVTFAPGEKWSLLDLVAMRDELKDIFGREVDLAEEKCVRNPFKRSEILRTKQVIYAA